MQFIETPIEGAYIIDVEKKEDHRGFFARAFCKFEFKNRGLNGDIVQCNLSMNGKMGTLRGMHYQVAPYSEEKIVRCVRGEVFDVIVDLRKDSPSYLEWFGLELSEENMRTLYVPKGVAHGYQCLVDDSMVFYMVTEFFNHKAERGIRWNDPAIGIVWKQTDDLIISEKDRAWSDLEAQQNPLKAKI